jgi:hypothetical protein
MCTLRIEHAVVDFATWKATFDRDPIGRRQSGVRAYRVFRPLDDARRVLIDLDFDAPAEAQQFLDSLQKLWRRAELSPGLERQAETPHARMLDEVVEERY